MRLATLVTGFVLALAGVATAATYDTPNALIEAFYAPYLRGAESFTADDVDAEAGFRSQALQALNDEDAAATPEGEIGTLDFDPYIGGQDWDLTDFEMDEAVVDGDTATVNVSFKNFGEARSLTYELVMEEDGWKIDDLVSNTPGDEFRLSEIFILAHAD